jgi:triacylglycerol lipase
MTRALVTAIVLLAVAFFGVVLYVAATFALMRPHAETRTLAASWRALLGESIYIAVTQPLLPLFYVFGHRVRGLWLVGVGRKAAERHPLPVVFVHGYMHNRVAFLGLARALARRGFGPIYALNYPWFRSVESNAARLAAYVERVCAETQSPAVDLVCHSMGGVVAMEALRKQKAEGPARIRRCVTIASPHGGIVWSGPLLDAGAASLRATSPVIREHASYRMGVPFLSIYSTHDNVVYPKTTSVLGARGGRDLEIAEMAHLSLLFSEDVADHVATFLREEP